MHSLRTELKKYSKQVDFTFTFLSEHWDICRSSFSYSSVVMPLFSST